jgi:hypothetical protein
VIGYAGGMPEGNLSSTNVITWQIRLYESVRATISLRP